MALRNTRIEATIEQVYGQPLHALQARLTGRQEFSAFGFVPTEPVRFMALDGRILTHDPASDHKFGGPRLLIEDRRRKVVTYEEIDEPARLATAEEWFMNTLGRIVPGPSAEPVVVMTRTEVLQ